MLRVEGITLGSSNTVRNLGVIFDLDSVKQMSRNAFFIIFFLQQIKIRNILFQSDTKK